MKKVLKKVLKNSVLVRYENRVEISLKFCNEDYEKWNNLKRYGEVQVRTSGTFHSAFDVCAISMLNMHCLSSTPSVEHIV